LGWEGTIGCGVKELRMFALIAAVLFAVAFVLNATGSSVPAILAPTSLMLAGLALLALHLSGYADTWVAPRRRTRRR
jgi:hypothetical protein